MAGALAILICLGMVIWLALGRPGRRTARGEEARRRGGRRARDRSFWGMPARDRAFEPGAVLVVLAAFKVAEVISDAAAAGQRSSPVTTAVFLGAAIAIGFAIRPDIVSAGMGLVGIVSLVLERLGASSCGESISQVQNLIWFASASALLFLIFTVRVFMAPVRSGQRVVAGIARPFWTSPGSLGPAGRFGSTALLAFGALELLDLAIRPEALQGLRSAVGPQPALILAGAVAAGILVFGAAVLPEFTTSVLGIAVCVANLIVLFGQPTPCTNAGLLLAIVAGFVGLSWLAKRFV